MFKARETASRAAVQARHESGTKLAGLDNQWAGLEVRIHRFKDISTLDRGLSEPMAAQGPGRPQSCNRTVSRSLLPDVILAGGLAPFYYGGARCLYISTGLGIFQAYCHYCQALIATLLGITGGHNPPKFSLPRSVISARGPRRPEPA